MSMLSRIRKLENVHQHGLNYPCLLPSGASEEERRAILAQFSADHPEARHGRVIGVEIIEKRRPQAA